MALSLDIRGGALSKMLLPYGEETSTLEQAHTSNRAEYEQLEELGLPEQDARELVQKALAARSLVRVKVADDNDLEQMLLACGELRDFFGDLAAHARNTPPTHGELAKFFSLAGIDKQSVQTQSMALKKARRLVRPIFDARVAARSAAREIKADKVNRCCCSRTPPLRRAG